MTTGPDHPPAPADPDASGGGRAEPPAPGPAVAGVTGPGVPWPQVVPRPPAAHPGGPPPWDVLPPADRFGLSLDVVTTALAARGQDGPVPAPGDGPHPFDTAPPPPAISEGPGGRPGGLGSSTAGMGQGPHASEEPGLGRPGGLGSTAAVLVTLFEEEGEARTVLTRRAGTLRAHRGEVSFPGGRLDPGEQAADAARREAAEEVGLDPAAVRLAGWLHPVVTFSAGSLIMPVVATLDRRPALEPSPAEVARVFDVSLAELVAPGAFHEERWTVPGRPVPGSADGSFPVWFFEVATETVWGATARMLYELLCLVLGVAPSGP